MKADSQERTGERIIESFPTEQLLECIQTDDTIRKVYDRLMDILANGDNREVIQVAKILFDNSVSKPQTRVDVTTNNRAFDAGIFVPSDFKK